MCVFLPPNQTILHSRHCLFLRMLQMSSWVPILHTGSVNLTYSACFRKSRKGFKYGKKRIHLLLSSTPTPKGLKGISISAACGVGVEGERWGHPTGFLPKAAPPLPNGMCRTAHNPCAPATVPSAQVVSVWGTHCFGSGRGTLWRTLLEQHYLTYHPHTVFFGPTLSTGWPKKSRKLGQQRPVSGPKPSFFVCLLYSDFPWALPAWCDTHILACLATWHPINLSQKERHQVMEASNDWAIMG